MFGQLKNQLNKLLKGVKERELTEKDVEELVDELKIILISNDVSFEVAEYISDMLSQRILGMKVPRFGGANNLIYKELKSILHEILSRSESTDLYSIIKKGPKHPYILVFFGVNGVGKTTTIAKIAYHLKSQGVKLVLACSDTFRAGAIEQLKYHADRLGVPMIQQKYGADPAAVAYDAIEHAKARDMDVVIIDTAGRQHSNINLMDELRKIVRVSEPDNKILVLDSLTGNDAYSQALYFNEGIGIDGVIFTKVDADSKGGAIITVAKLLEKPIYYLGIGQSYSDLIPFSASYILDKLFEFRI
jgi:fused signal recognition particle receptor